MTNGRTVGEILYVQSLRKKPCAKKMCPWELPSKSIVNEKPGFDFYFPIGTANTFPGLALSLNLPNNQVKYILLVCIFLG